MVPSGSASLEAPLWRANAVFRFTALGYAVVLVATNFRDYAHPVLGWLVIAGMAAWTVFATYAYSRPVHRRWPLLGADLAVAAASLIAVRWVSDPTPPPLPWVAGAVLAWAVSGGRRRGAVAALVMGAIDLFARGDAVDQGALNGTVLLLLAGIAVGHVARLAIEAQERLQRATVLESATRERERLARHLHDSVLQVLALVQRRGADLGGESAELGRLAGEQAAALRALVASAAYAPGVGEDADLRVLVGSHAAPNTSIATPATAVVLPARTAREVAGAVAAALDNVRQHCGAKARAWVLVEDEDDMVTVTVRDDGPGIPDGRLDRAATEGRLGVAQSIRGRIEDLGGTVTITAVPGSGTEVELRVPR